MGQELTTKVMKHTKEEFQEVPNKEPFLRFSSWPLCPSW